MELTLYYTVNMATMVYHCVEEDLNVLEDTSATELKEVMQDFESRQFLSKTKLNYINV